MADFYEQIGQKIRELRDTNGRLSQDSLAEELGVSPNTISRWETGTYKPTPEDLEQISRFFKISITAFFQNSNENKNDERINALASAIGGLDEDDFEEIIRYAEFRKTRIVMKNAKRNRSKRLRTG